MSTTIKSANGMSSQYWIFDLFVHQVRKYLGLLSINLACGDIKNNIQTSLATEEHQLSEDYS